MLGAILSKLQTQGEYILTNYREYIIIALGLLFVVGAWRDWAWITSPRNIPRSSLFQQFLYEYFGERAYRIFLGCGGLVVVVCGMLFLLYRLGKL